MSSQSGRSLFEFSFYSLRLLEAVRETTQQGLKFEDLVRECLTEMLGEMGACSTVASLGIDSLADPNIFAKRIEALFGFGGRTILNSFIAFAERKVEKPRQLVTA